MERSYFEKEAFRFINKARNKDDMTVSITGSLPENIRAIMSTYGYFGSNVLNVSNNDYFYKLTVEGIALLEERDIKKRTEKRANIALWVSVAAVIISVIALFVKKTEGL